MENVELLKPPIEELLPQPNTTAAMSLRNLWKTFGNKTAVADVSLDIPQGSFYGIVGPNGAGKTTTLSMATGLLRPDQGSAMVLGHDVWSDAAKAKQLMGVLPDGVRLFDRLTGAQLITYSGLLRGMDRATVSQRTNDLLAAMDLKEAGNKFVVDYSAGMTKKVSLACAMIHAPKLLILDEPFEAVDPVSAANIRDILHRYVENGGTVVISSHVMDLVQRTCSHVAIMANAQVVASGTVDAVRNGRDLEDRFVELVGGRRNGEGLTWLGQ